LYIWSSCSSILYSLLYIVIYLTVIKYEGLHSDGLFDLEHRQVYSYIELNPDGQYITSPSEAYLTEEKIKQEIESKIEAENAQNRYDEWVTTPSPQRQLLKSPKSREWLPSYLITVKYITI